MLLFGLNVRGARLTNMRKKRKQARLDLVLCTNKQLDLRSLFFRVNIAEILEKPTAMTGARRYDLWLSSTKIKRQNYLSICRPLGNLKHESLILQSRDLQQRLKKIVYRAHSLYH